MPCGKPAHCGKCLDEYFRHLGALKITGRKHECPHPRFYDGRHCRSPISNQTVLRQDSPSFPTSFLQPFLILCVWREMIIMNVNFDARLAEGIRDFVSTEGSIDEESEGATRLRLRART